MIKMSTQEIDFILASMEKIMIPASASPTVVELLDKLKKEKESLVKKEQKKAEQMKIAEANQKGA